MKNVVITQSNYIPWKGYFDAIALADEFVIYDDMQYTRRDWRNRNLIKTPGGPQWLTIPVEVKGKYFQKINETEVSERDWNVKHWRTLQANYAKAPYFRDLKDWAENLYMTVPSTNLTEINHHFLSGICRLIGIEKRFRFSSEFELAEERTERLVNICRDLGGTDYHSGPAAKAYMDESKFTEHGIRVHYFDYSCYPEYRQLHPPFEHGVSILDLIFNEGARLESFMKNLKPKQ